MCVSYKTSIIWFKILRIEGTNVLIVTEKEEIFSDALIYSGDKRVASVAAFDL